MISKVPDYVYYLSFNLILCCAVKEQKHTAQLLCNILACTLYKLDLVNCLNGAGFIDCYTI